MPSFNDIKFCEFALISKIDPNSSKFEGGIDCVEVKIEVIRSTESKFH